MNSWIWDGLGYFFLMFTTSPICHSHDFPAAWSQWCSGGQDDDHVPWWSKRCEHYVRWNRRRFLLRFPVVWESTCLEGAQDCDVTVECVARVLSSSIVETCVFTLCHQASFTVNAVLLRQWRTLRTSLVWQHMACPAKRLSENCWSSTMRSCASCWYLGCQNDPECTWKILKARKHDPISYRLQHGSQRAFINLVFSELFRPLVKH